MTDVVLNLNSCAERAIFSHLLSNCVYIIKHGLLSPELFIRRVQKRQSKRLRKKGVNMNMKGCEYAVAENILHHLKTLPNPLIPWNLYQQLRGLLDVYTPEARSSIVVQAFKNTKMSTAYVLQALLKTLFLMGCFENSTTCPGCEKTLEGNGISRTMVAVPITSYLLRERAEGTGHWFISWGQQASDVEVIKILAQHWREVGAAGNIIPEPSLPSLVQWYCQEVNGGGSHGATEPHEIPVVEVEHLISPLTFKQQSFKPSTDFEISLYKGPPDNCCSRGHTLRNTVDMTTPSTQDKISSVTLKSLKKQLGERSSSCRGEDGRSRAERKAATIDLVRWIIRSRKEKVENIWAPARGEKLSLGEESCDHSDKSRDQVPNRSGEDYQPINGRFDQSSEADQPTDQSCEGDQPIDKLLQQSHDQSLDQPCEEPRDQLPEGQLEEKDKSNMLLEVMAGNILAGCGGGTWDMWAPAITPPPKNAAIYSGSYWSEDAHPLHQPLPPSPPPPPPPPASSRILSLLERPSLERLQVLADKLAPTTRKHQPTAGVSSLTFKKPPHLVKEFIPRCGRNVSTPTTNITSITSLRRGSLLGPGVKLRPIALQARSIPGGMSPPGLTHPATYATQYPSYTVVSADVIPPLPRELVHETPPNLSTIKVLSQLFTGF